MFVELMKDKVESFKSDKHKERGSSGKDIQSTTTGKTNGGSHP